MRFVAPLCGLAWVSACEIQVIFPDGGPEDSATETDTDTDTDADADTDTDSDTDTDGGTLPTDSGWVHPEVTDTTLCWDCHEPDRPPDHYPGQDCAACHQTTDWRDFDLHEVIFPHGMVSSSIPTAPTEWVVSCASCHLDPVDRRQFDCVTCHDADPQFVPHGGAEDPADSPLCLACHPTAAM